MALKALIVYKDSAVAQLIAEAFSSVGLEVLSAGSLSEAAQLISRERYDGIFVDPATPLLEGCELAKSVRQSFENRNAPVRVGG